MSKFEPSPYQKAIFDFVATGTGSAVIEAVAGSGKTTTIVESLNLIPKTKQVLFLAFNKAIAYFKNTNDTYLYSGGHGGVEDNRFILSDTGLGLHNQADFFATNNPNSFIRDRRVGNAPNNFLPHNRDSFLLISPGPDLKYGTFDDVANFPVPGQ